MVYKTQSVGADARNRASVEKGIVVIRELDAVILDSDLPEHGLVRGDVGTVVLVHGDGEGYEVEFTALDGETVAVVTLSAKEVREIRQGEIAHARDVARVF